VSLCVFRAPLKISRNVGVVVWGKHVVRLHVILDADCALL
jgi:hypothetical protein